MGRMLRLVVGSVILVVLGSCSAAEEPLGARIALRDPYALIDDITPRSLRVLVFPAAGVTCDSASGVVTPPPPEADGAPVPSAVVDTTVDIVMNAATSRLDLIAGDYVVLVRGRGNDVPSMRTNAVIASGCAATTVVVGETRDVPLELKPVVISGSCGDGVLSPDEQCEDSNTAPGDGCDARCQTEAFRFNEPAGGDEALPSIAWATGMRAVGAYDSTVPTDGIHLMYRDERGRVISSPTALAVDADFEPLPGIQTQAAVSIGGDRVFVAFGDFSMGALRGSDVRVKIFSIADRVTPPGMATSVFVHTGGDMDQDSPAIATRDDGTTMVVFQDAAVPTRMRGRGFAAGSVMPDGGDAFAVGGAGAGLGSGPRVAPTSSGFIVVFSAGGDIFTQRFSGAFMATDAMARPLLTGGDASGTQDQPTIATFGCSGAAACGIIAWRDDGPMGDGDGTSIRAIVISGDGSPMGAPFTVDTTTAGAQSAPTVAAGVSRYGVAWESGGSIRARVFAIDGSPALNRAKEPTPSANDFTVAPSGAHPTAAIGGADGALMVGWEAGGDISARLFALP